MLKFLKLMLFLTVALSPAVAAAITNGENRSVIIAMIAVLVGYACAVILGTAMIRRFRRGGIVVQA